MAATDPHAAARRTLRQAGNDALTLAAKIDTTIHAVHDLWGPAGVGRLESGVTPAATWAEEKRALAKELFASADALAPETKP